jgi:plastocyanin
MDQTTPEITPSVEPKKTSQNFIWIVLGLVILGALAFTAQKFLVKSTPASAAPTAAVATAANEITVEGGKFYFKPNEIKVKVNQPVKIVFNNVEGFHDFVLDEFNVKSETIAQGKSTTVEFTPTKTGTFEYYCSVTNHRQMGMVGKLIVE